MRILAVVITVLMFLSLLAFAQDKMPQVPKEVKSLDQFLGTWSGPTTMTDTAGKKSGKMATTVKVTKAADGWGIVSEVSSKMEKGGAYHETAVWGYNGDDQTLHMFLVNNMGQASDYKGKWDDDKSLTLDWSGKMMGRDGTGKFVLTHADAKTMHFTNEYTVDGKTTMYEGTLKKK